MTMDADLQAVLLAAQTLGTTNPDELLPVALDIADAAARLQYVRRVRAIKPDGTNFAELFPQLAAKPQSTVSTYVLKPTGVTRPTYQDQTTNETKTLNVAQISYEKPAQWTRSTKNHVQTDYLDNGWQPRYMARTAQQAIKDGAVCRWYWHTYQLEGDAKARDLIWLERTGAAPRQQPLPPEQQMQQRQPPQAAPQVTPEQYQQVTGQPPQARVYPEQAAAVAEAMPPAPTQDPRALERAQQKVGELNDQHRGLLETFMTTSELPIIDECNDRQLVAIANYAEELLKMQAHAYQAAGEEPF